MKSPHDYADLGWPVLPVVGKSPVTPNGVLDATTDHRVIDAWWTGNWIGAGVAIRTQEIVVIDIDAPRGGLSDAKTLTAKHPGWRDGCPVANTGGGGWHVLFRRPPEWRHNGAHKCRLTVGIDVKPWGGYIVAEPTPGYRWAKWTKVLPEVPDWMFRFLRTEEKEICWSRASHAQRPVSDVLAVALAYASKLPPAVSGQHGHDATFVACLKLLQFPLSDDELWEALSTWNSTCSPPWSEADLKRKLNQAKKARK